MDINPQERISYVLKNCFEKIDFLTETNCYTSYANPPYLLYTARARLFKNLTAYTSSTPGSRVKYEIIEGARTRERRV